MRTIWKTVLKSNEQLIEVPADAELLCAREQDDQICVWYRCNPDLVRETRKIAVTGTGHIAPEGGRYLGTASLQGLMFHVFDISGSRGR